jgi:hypothetical protein
MKSSLHRLTCKPELNSLPSLLSHLRLPTQRDSPNSISAGIGSSLYSLGVAPAENTVSIVIAQQYLDWCLLIHCHGNLFTESLSSKELLLWLYYPDFRASCHSTYWIFTNLACQLRSWWYHTRLISWRWRRYAPPKRRLTFNGLHSLYSRRWYFS